MKRAALVVKVVMKQLFVALKRLHAMGIVHRDIKPVRDSAWSQSLKLPAPTLEDASWSLREARHMKLSFWFDCIVGTRHGLVQG